MKRTEQQCDTTKVDEYLAGQLDSDQQTDFETHVTECEACQNELELRAADLDVWNKAKVLLSENEDSRINESDGEETSDGYPRTGMMVLDSLAPTDDPEMLGRLGEYEISGVVGVGGMGAVLRGFDKSLRRVVAIKVMAPHLAGSGPARTRFQREARAAAAITHDNIIDIYGVAEAVGLPYIVMPFARGPSLQNRIDRSGPLTAIEVVRIGKQIASGLSAAHEQGLVHRDIKPANILLNVGVERLWITDFGVARAMDDASMTKTGVIAGTPQYMSPEQARGEPVDHRSDLFSLGSVLYSACTGRAPFRSETSYGILRRITDTDPTHIRELNPDIPDWLCQIIRRLMAKQPGERFQDASEVAELLEGCLAHLQQPSHVELPAGLPTAQTTSRQGNRLAERKSQSPLADLRRRIPRPSRTAIGRFVLPGALLLMMFAAWQATTPIEITGTWKGEQWESVSLSSVDDASGWYNGTFTDSDGNRGAIKLEWSRTQRRYNGRWKSGDDRSGSITLRAGEPGEVRGAVSADPETPIRKDQPRLREFSWQRLSPQVQQASKPVPAESSRNLAEQVAIRAPQKGVIVERGSTIQNNAYVKRGDLIVTLAPFESEVKSQLAQMRRVLVQQLDASKSVAATNARSLETATSHLAAMQKQADSYAEVQRGVVAAAEAVIANESSKVEAAAQRRDYCKAALQQYKNELEIKKKVQGEGLVSMQELKASEAKLQKGEAQLAEANAVLESTKNVLVIAQKERDAKRAKAQVEVDIAQASVKKAEFAVLAATDALKEAEANLASAEKELADVDQKMTLIRRFRVVAPVDGRIVKLTTAETVREGEVLCVIQPDQASEDARRDNTTDDGSISTPRRQDSAVLEGLPPRAGDSGQGLMSALSTASSIAARIRDQQIKLDAAESALARGGKDPSDPAIQRSLDRLRADMSAIEQEKETIVKMLRTRREAADGLRAFQQDLYSQMGAAVDAGAMSEFEAIVAKHSLAVAERELQLLDQLISFYATIEEADLTKQQQSIIEVLQNQIDRSQSLQTLQQEITDRITTAFEAGQLSIDEALEARKDLAQSKAEQQELKLLLDHYNRVRESILE